LADRADSIFSLGNESLSVAAVKNPMRKGELKQRLPRLASYLNWAGENYDWLVLDCPPVLSSAWNHWFHDYARPALLVIREQHTPAIQVRQTISRMRYRIKGILLNDSGNVAASGRKVTQSDKCLREVGSPNEFK
jgi:Mrp family chromosome partitioning ATPase